MNSLAIGIDMGGTSVKMGVCRGPELVWKDPKPIVTSHFDGPQALVDEMVRRVKAMQESHPEIAAVGVGVPGFVNSKSGLVHELTNVPGWTEYYLAKELARSTGLRAVAENDANCMGLAELHHGAGRGLEHFIAITLGTGVGGAVFINGALYRGAHCGAGEVGQMTIDYQGAPGPHGNVGSLERYVGNRFVGLNARKKYAASGQPKREDETTPLALFEAAKDGDPVAEAVWEDFTTQLAAGLTHSIWLLNPEAIIIGGGIANAGDLIFRPLKRKLDAQLAGPFRDHLSILPARFGNEAGTIGAAALALAEGKKAADFPA